MACCCKMHAMVTDGSPAAGSAAANHCIGGASCAQHTIILMIITVAFVDLLKDLARATRWPSAEQMGHHLMKRMCELWAKAAGCAQMCHLLDAVTKQPSRTVWCCCSAGTLLECMGLSYGDMFHNTFCCGTEPSDP
jgi:hypothetical protein